MNQPLQAISFDRRALLDLSGANTSAGPILGCRNYTIFDGELGAALAERTDEVFVSLIGRSAMAPFPRDRLLIHPPTGKRLEVIT